MDSRCGASGTNSNHRKSGPRCFSVSQKKMPPLMIFDTLRNAHTSEENDATEMGAIMETLRAYTAVGATVVILHHPAKTEGSTGRGSTVIHNESDFAYTQEIAKPEDGGLIKLQVNKTRTGDWTTVTIRPDWDQGTFTVVDSHQFTKANEDSDKLSKIIAATPGMSQNAICAAAGMKKNRCLDLLQEGTGNRWNWEHRGRSKVYFSMVPKTGTMPGTVEPVRVDGIGYPPYKGNREPSTNDPTLIGSQSPVPRKNFTCEKCGACFDTSVGVAKHKLDCEGLPPINATG